MSEVDEARRAQQDRLIERAREYRRTFGGDSQPAQRVLDDLRVFCHASSTTFEIEDPGGRTSAMLEGRRQVWLRIQGYLNFEKE